MAWSLLIPSGVLAATRAHGLMVDTGGLRQARAACSGFGGIAPLDLQYLTGVSTFYILNLKFEN